jgi:hypothetical protein
MSGMNPFILKIPLSGNTSQYGDPFETLNHINLELRRLPGVTDDDFYGWDLELLGTWHDHKSGVRCLDIHQNHGIRNKLVHTIYKKSFKEAMSKLIKIYPDMPFPFQGRIEFHSHGGNLKEVHFIQP